METKDTYLHKHFFFFVLALFIVIVGIISYYRFMVRQDYVVSYQGVCDPVKEKCFINCEDDACIKMDYYSNVLKYAPDLYAECGKDITNCEVASVCLPNDHKCSITYCDPQIDGDICSASLNKLDIQSGNQVDPGEQRSLQNNNTNNQNI